MAGLLNLGVSLRFLTLFSFISATTALAANFSFQGNFGQDDQLQPFVLVVTDPSTVTFMTWSYGGGINAAGDTVVRGGFDPVLSLFTGNLDPNGLLIGANNDGTCPPANNDPVTGACWDSVFSAGLVPGVYTLMLSQSDNTPLGSTLADGFSRVGQGNFTGPNFIGQPGAFWDANPNQRDGHWAVDILNVESAAAIPEPSTFALLGAGSLLFLAARRHRRQA